MGFGQIGSGPGMDGAPPQDDGAGFAINHRAGDVGQAGDLIRFMRGAPAGELGIGADEAAEQCVTRAAIGDDRAQPD